MVNGKREAIGEHDFLGIRFRMRHDMPKTLLLIWTRSPFGKHDLLCQVYLLLIAPVVTL